MSEAAEGQVDGEAPAPEPEPESLFGALVTWSHGQQVLHPDRASYLGLVEPLHSETFRLCSDLCAVDYLSHAGRSLPGGVAAERFEVVVNLVSMEFHRRLRIRVQVPESDPVVPSLFAAHPGTEAMEREVYDLMGIRFEGHPDLTRIMMPEDWEGHPLRKDYSVGRVPVQFKAAPLGR